MMGKCVRQRKLVDDAKRRVKPRIRLKPMVIIVRMMLANWGQYHG